MKKEKKPKSFLDKAYYEGGSKALSAFISQHLKYPKEAQTHQVSGTVVIKYTIDHKGKVIETKVVSGIGHGCDEEAERVVRLLEFKVGSYRNIRVQFHKTIKIHFRKDQIKVNADEVQPPTTPKPASIQYTITKTSKKGEALSTKTSKPTSYSYSIQIPKKS